MRVEYNPLGYSSLMFLPSREEQQAMLGMLRMLTKMFKDPESLSTIHEFIDRVEKGLEGGVQ